MDELQTRLPVLGETLLGAGSLKLVPGGKGANQAVAIARLGGAVAMVWRVGNDPFNEQAGCSSLERNSLIRRLEVHVAKCAFDSEPIDRLYYQ